MNILDFTIKFQNLEDKNDFFNYKDDTNLAFWDLVRFDIFYAIYFPKSFEERKFINTLPLTSKKNIKNIISKIYNIAKFYFVINLRKPKYLCFVCSRYKNDDGLNFDIASNDIVNIIKENSIIFESYLQEGAYLHSHVFNSGLFMKRLQNLILNKTKKHHKQQKYDISNILRKEFNVEIDFDNLIDTLIENYKIEYKYYSNLFKKLEPKAIFIVQNGIQKGLFAAANDIDIPVVELQHGLIGYIHPAYSYPKSILKNQLKTLPKFFLSFSSFWTSNTHFPVQEIIQVGNSYFARKVIKSKQEYDITFIFADIYTEELRNLLDKLILTGFNGRICIKLHPNQYKISSEIINYYKPYTFIVIICNEKSIEYLLSVSRSILAIQSTVVYQALHNNVKVLLYKRMDFQTHKDIFNNQLVELIESADDIVKAINESNQESVQESVFFNQFNEDLFKDILNKSIG